MRSESERFILNIIDCTPIAQFAIDLNHKITYWNRACELFTGFGSREMIGTDHQWVPFYPAKRPVLADLIVDGQIEKLESMYEGKKPRKSDVILHAWQATDYFENVGGRNRHILFVAAPAIDSNGKMVGAVETLQDISKRVQAEADLISSEERYRILTEKVADGIILLQDKRLIFANHVSAKILGHASQDRLMGQKVEDFIAPDYRNVYRKMSRGFRAGDFREKTVRIKCLRGDRVEIWVEVHNEFIQWEGKPAILATLQDITESRTREMAIHEETASLRKENRRLKAASRGRYRLGDLIGKSQPMQEVYDVILKAAATEENVIIMGESGTGKELVARAIYEISDRKEGEFVPVNCGAIPESLMESEFFGHKRGAFTGAVADTHGYLALAHGGVLFLDEVGDLPLMMQVKLLRALEGRGYTPVGSSRTETSDCRIVAATHKDLKRSVRSGLMREDFFYRMHVIPVHMPALRHRKEDIPLLVEHFLKRYQKDGKSTFLSGRTMDRLRDYDWPGNVRELENWLRRYLAVGHLDFSGIGANSPSPSKDLVTKVPEVTGMSLTAAVERYEKRLVADALQQNRWHKAKAAAHLGISRRTLFRKIKSLELS